MIEEPDNPEDPNAIKVVMDGEPIGYIKAGSCARVKKLIREERIVFGTAYERSLYQIWKLFYGFGCKGVIMFTKKY